MAVFIIPVRGAILPSAPVVQSGCVQVYQLAVDNITVLEEVSASAHSVASPAAPRIAVIAAAPLIRKVLGSVCFKPKLETRSALVKLVSRISLCAVCFFEKRKKKKNNGTQ